MKIAIAGAAPARLSAWIARRGLRAARAPTFEAAKKIPVGLVQMKRLRASGQDLDDIRALGEDADGEA